MSKGLQGNEAVIAGLKDDNQRLKYALSKADWEIAVLRRKIEKLKLEISDARDRDYEC